MAKNIEPKLMKIGDYLQLEEDVYFNIPEYQRAYSWQIDQCDKLWQDITEYVANASKDPHFFGTIIINCQNNDKELSLIDGQQRTTTFLLLLKALLIRINVAIGKTEKDEDSESLYRGLKERRRKIIGILYKVETEDIPDKPDYTKDINICKNVNILKNNSVNERFKDELNAILKAVNFEEAESNIIPIKYKKKDNKYSNFFRNFKYFYEMSGYLSESELNSVAKAVTNSCEVIEIKSWQVEQAINMFNSLNSDGLPLYDSDIISAKLYAAAEQMGNSKEFQDLWKDLLDQIEELNISGIADIDSILMQKMYYERAIRNQIVTETGSINVTTPGLRRYFTDINKDPINNPIDFCEHMVNLTKIWKKVSSYPIAQVLFKFNENSKLFLASYFSRFDENDISEDKVFTIFECMLRLFTVMELVDTGYSSSNFKTFLFGEEVKLVDKNVTEQEIKEDFNKHIGSKWSMDFIKDKILDYEKNNLVYLNEYLFAIENQTEFNLGNKYDIEHIMPISGKNIQTIRNDAGIVSEDEFTDIVNKLGNKILLETKINRSVGNEWFRTKVSTKLENKTGYIDSAYPIACALVNKYGNVDKPYWNKEDIICATEKASERIIRFIFGE